MQKRLALLLISILLLPVWTSSAQESNRAVFETADCAFETPNNHQVDCGYLIVPEDRGDPDSPTIRLHVAIFRSRAAEPQPDPIVYLEGGPGGSGIKTDGGDLRADFFAAGPNARLHCD